MIKLVPTFRDHNFIVFEDFTYKTITVPQGYRTNGADIPRLFWWYIPPFSPKYLPAVVVHDYLCDLEDYKLADKYFEELLLLLAGRRTFKIRVMVMAVKLYHRIRYGVK